MKKPVAIAVYGTVGLVLFLGTYVGIAFVSGAPLHEVPGISMFVDPPEASPEGEQEVDVATEDSDVESKTADEVVEASVGLIGAYTIQNPFTPQELRDLVGELKKQMREHTVERERMRVKSLELDEWEQSLRERQAELAGLRVKLEDLESSIDLRMDELIRDEGVRAEEDLLGWKNMAKLYESGTADESAAMLKLETPEDAALILRELKESRAGEILLKMGTPEQRKKYMDAYRIASAAKTPE